MEYIDVLFRSPCLTDGVVEELLVSKITNSVISNIVIHLILFLIK